MPLINFHKYKINFRYQTLYFLVESSVTYLQTFSNCLFTLDFILELSIVKNRFNRNQKLKIQKC